MLMVFITVNGTAGTVFLMAQVPAFTICNPAFGSVHAFIPAYAIFTGAQVTGLAAG